MTYLEKDCTITHEGRTFEAGAAAYDGQRIVAYVGKPLGDGMGCDRSGPTSQRALTDWHGRQIGTIMLGKGWRIRSYLSDRMYQGYARVNGVTYTGRTLGEGLAFTGRRCAKQP